MSRTIPLFLFVSIAFLAMTDESASASACINLMHAKDTFNIVFGQPYSEDGPSSSIYSEYQTELKELSPLYAALIDENKINSRELFYDLISYGTGQRRRAPFMKAGADSPGVTAPVFKEAIDMELAILNGTIANRITSNELAIYVVRRLQRYPNQRSQILAQLQNESAYFRNIKTPKTSINSVIGYALEREMEKTDFLNGPPLTDYYRLVRYTEEEWFKILRVKRWQLFMAEPEPLEASTGEPERLQFLPAFISTSRKPELWGELTKEVIGGVFGPFEFKHADFEIDQEEFFHHRREAVAKFGNENFHEHITFEVPNDYSSEKFQYFGDWLYQLNQFYFFKNLERRRLPSVQLKRATRKTFRINSDLWTKIPSDLADLSDPGKSKYMYIAARSKIYGEETPGMTRVGLEIRGDYLADDEVYEENHRNIVTRIESEGWVRKEDDETPFVYEVANENVAIIQFQKQGFGVSVQNLAQSSAGFEAPLQSFETAHFYNYRTGTWFYLTEEQISRIRSARANYLHALKNLEQELNTYGDYNSFLEKAEAILFTWAKEARPSEFYEYF